LNSGQATEIRGFQLARERRTRDLQVTGRISSQLRLSGRQ
jgi:hypothetical protein